MSKIELRKYEPSDLQSLIDVFRQSVRELACKDYSVSQILAWAPDYIDPISFSLRRESKPTWIAELDGRIAGFSDLEADGHIDMLYVHPDFRSQGVARALLQHLESIALQQGIAQLHAEVSITARPVFVRHGFRVITEQTVTHGGETYINLQMQKPLIGE